MTPTLLALGIISVAELLLWQPSLWRWRRAFSRALIAALSVTSVGLILVAPRVWVVLLALFSVYRVINLSRIVTNRTQNDYLFHTARKTSFCLIGGQIIILIVAKVAGGLGLSLSAAWYAVAGVQLVAAFVILASTQRQLRTTKAPELTGDTPDRDMPSLTVAIPARNETIDLEACLQSLLASDYHKLEILVLDDCSQDKRTPEIIRGYAHDGVRFMAGSVPPEHWLAKNFAYDQLAKQANGELILFCGVDAQFGPDSLNQIVKTLLQKQKTMLSIVPRSYLPRQHGLMSSVVQSCRYAWELALPRRLFERPPVLSTCWIITKQALDGAGGFESYRQSVLPEKHLARHCAATADGYSFMCSDDSMGVSSQKSFDKQVDTAVRVRYPQLHRRPELVGLVSLLEFGILVWPFIILATSLALQDWVLGALSLATCICLVVFYGRIMNRTYRSFLLRGLWLLPAAALYDIGLLNYSMWQYEFHEVLWKGRNVCVSVMRVIPSLPKIDA